MDRRRARALLEGEAGQALPLALAGAVIVLAVVGGLFLLGVAHVTAARAQTAADLTAVSAARELVRPPPTGAAPDTPDRAALEPRVAAMAARAARGAGAELVEVVLGAGETWPPTTVEVVVRGEGPMGLPVRARARAGLAPSPAGDPQMATARGGGYGGPLVFRDGEPMCPPVAAAYDAMDAAARADGVDLVVVSGFRSDAEQAVLFRRHPDPRWVAPPGRSRHRDATELDLSGAGGAWAWLADHGERFGFVQRYSWEPWHWGYPAGCGGAAGVPDGAALQPWVPDAHRALIARSAAQGGVPAPVLAALLRAESGFDPRAVSAVGALGIAQFMPATARAVGLADPFDPAQAIPAAARLLGAHLRALGSLPLALAAYNAGPGAVRRYAGVPPYRETRDYVARVLALAGGFPALGGAVEVRLLPVS